MRHSGGNCTQTHIHNHFRVLGIYVFFHAESESVLSCIIGRILFEISSPLMRDPYLKTGQQCYTATYSLAGQVCWKLSLATAAYLKGWGFVIFICWSIGTYFISNIVACIFQNKFDSGTQFYDTKFNFCSNRLSNYFYYMPKNLRLGGPGDLKGSRVFFDPGQEGVG